MAMVFAFSSFVIGPALAGGDEPAAPAKSLPSAPAGVSPQEHEAHHRYPDGSPDAAFLVAVLGEIPDQEAALAEFARVLKRGGRLVVGELFGDPHWVSPKRLRRRAEAAGLSFSRRSGTPLGYFARFERP